eukprot:gene1396-57106_t
MLITESADTASGALFPNHPSEGKFAQLYLYDPEQALERRIADPNKQLDEGTLRWVQQSILRLRFCVPDSRQKRYSAPTVHEVARVFTSPDGTPP